MTIFSKEELDTIARSFYYEELKAKRAILIAWGSGFLGGMGASLLVYLFLIQG